MNRLTIQNSILKFILFVLTISLIGPSILYAARTDGSSPALLYEALKTFQDAKEKEKEANANLRSAIEKAREARNKQIAAAENATRTSEYRYEKIQEIASQIWAKRDELAKVKTWPEALRERKQKFDKIYNDFKDEKPPFKEGKVRENFATDRRLRQEFNEINAEINKWRKERDEKKKKIEKEIELLEYKKILLENEPPEYAEVDKTTEEKLNIEWAKAALDVSARDKEVRKAEKAVSDAFEKYLEEMGKMPPPFLQSVSVSDGSRTYYKKQYTSADLHVQANKIQEEMVKLEEEIEEGDRLRKRSSDGRVELTEELKPKIKRLNRYANQYRDEVWNRELALVITEVVITATEIALTGGTATLVRIGEEVTAEVAADMPKKRFTRKIGDIWQKHLDDGLGTWAEFADETRDEVIVITSLAKSTVSHFWKWPHAAHGELIYWEVLDQRTTSESGPTPGKGKTEDTPGRSTRTEAVSDTDMEDILREAEDNIKRERKDLKEGKIEIGESGLTQENKSWEIAEGEFYEWGLESLFKGIHDIYKDIKAKKGWNLKRNLWEGFNNRGTVFSVVNASAKIAVSNLFFDPERYIERFWTLYAEIAVIEKMRYELLKADRQISNVQKAYRRRIALQKARLDKLNRTLKPESIKNDAVTDKKTRLTLSLEFSTNITSPPIVKVAGLDIRMKPEGSRDNSKVWKGTIDVEKLDTSKNNAPIVVSLQQNSRPYDALDSDPNTPAFALLTKCKSWDELLFKKNWRGYEKGADTNHRIRFATALKIPDKLLTVSLGNNKETARVIENNPFTLRVITKTGPTEDAYTDSTSLYVSINGEKAHRKELDNPHPVDDFESGATDSFDREFNYPLDKIESIHLEADGSDAWHCTGIIFQFIKGDKKSEVYVFELDQWFSTEERDRVEDDAVATKIFPVRPKLK